MNKNPSDDQQSPIFVQFLDCVYQLQLQFPFLFEFNSDFLIFIVDELYSCKFGTFLYNCERERVEYGLHEKCVSLWSEILTKKQMFINPLFENKVIEKPRIPATSYFQLQIWKDYFCRHTSWLENTKILTGFKTPQEEMI
jgi:hypothetical protein